MDRGINIYRTSSAPAPKEWEDIPEVKEQRPHPSNKCEVSLQRIDGTNVCLWHTRKHIFWNPYGEAIFIIKEKKK